MKKFILVSIAFLLALLSMPTQILAQELPNWVHEMKKSTINYTFLTKEFNDYWKDKKKDASEFNRKFEEEEFVIDESYGWLRMYIRQYFELIKLRPQRNPNHLKSQDISQNRLLSQGQWTVAGPASAPEDIFSSWSGVPYGVGRINHLAFSGTNANVMLRPQDCLSLKTPAIPGNPLKQITWDIIRFVVLQWIQRMTV